MPVSAPHSSSSCLPRTWTTSNNIHFLCNIKTALPYNVLLTRETNSHYAECTGNKNLPIFHKKLATWLQTCGYSPSQPTVIVKKRAYNLQRWKKVRVGDGIGEEEESVDLFLQRSLFLAHYCILVLPNPPRTSFPWTGLPPPTRQFINPWNCLTQCPLRSCVHGHRTG